MRIDGVARQSSESRPLEFTRGRRVFVSLLLLSRKGDFTMTIKKTIIGLLVLVAAVAACLGGLAMARPNPRDDEAMHRLSVIRLGAKRDEIISKYGQASESVMLASGIESLRFQHGPDLRLLVEVAPESKRVIQIYYRKKTPFSGIQITELLDRNSEGSKWWPVRVSGDEHLFHRLDGGQARGRGKVDDAYQFAVLSGSEVRGRDPIADAEREKVKSTLQEIE